MGRFDRVIADAKVVITDISINALNSAGSNLKVREYVDELTRQLRVLEEDRRQSALQRLKDAMFDTSQDKQKNEACRQAVNLTYQLQQCLRCKCASCAMIEDACRCEGCLFGSHVTACEGGLGVETRAVERGVCLLDGMQVVLAEYDRRKRETTVTLLDRNDVKRRCTFDPATGRKNPL